MKLRSFEHKDQYIFLLEFVDHTRFEVDLFPLLAAYMNYSR